MPAGSSLTAKKVKFAEPVSELQGKLAAMLATPSAIVVPRTQPMLAPIPIAPAYRSSQQETPIETAIAPALEPQKLTPLLDGMM